MLFKVLNAILAQSMLSTAYETANQILCILWHVCYLLWELESLLCEIFGKLEERFDYVESWAFLLALVMRPSLNPVSSPCGSWSSRTSPPGIPHRTASRRTAFHTCRHPETTSRTQVHICPFHLPSPGGSLEKCSLEFPLPLTTGPSSWPEQDLPKNPQHVKYETKCV